MSQNNNNHHNVAMLQSSSILNTKRMFNDVFSEDTPGSYLSSSTSTTNNNNSNVRNTNTSRPMQQQMYKINTTQQPPVKKQKKSNITSKKPSCPSKAYTNPAAVNAAQHFKSVCSKASNNPDDKASYKMQQLINSSSNNNSSTNNNATTHAYGPAAAVMKNTAAVLTSSGTTLGTVPSASALNYGGWQEEEDSALRDAVLRHGDQKWNLVREYFIEALTSSSNNTTSNTGNYIKHRSLEEYERRWTDVVCRKHKKGPWTADEDKLVCDLVKHNGPKKWSTLAAYVPGRTGKQCRERWVNHLSPDVNKGEWTEEEEQILLSEHQRLGNQWCKIAQALPGRSENAVKNRWNSFANRCLSHQSKHDKNSDITNVDLMLLKGGVYGNNTGNHHHRSRNNHLKQKKNGRKKKQQHQHLVADTNVISSPTKFLTKDGTLMSPHKAAAAANNDNEGPVGSMMRIRRRLSKPLFIDPHFTEPRNNSASSLYDQMISMLDNDGMMPINNNGGGGGQQQPQHHHRQQQDNHHSRASVVMTNNDFDDVLGSGPWSPDAFLSLSPHMLSPMSPKGGLGAFKLSPLANLWPKSPTTAERKKSKSSSNKKSKVKM